MGWRTLAVQGGNGTGDPALVREDTRVDAAGTEFLRGLDRAW